MCQQCSHDPRIPPDLKASGTTEKSYLSVVCNNQVELSRGCHHSPQVSQKLRGKEYTSMKNAMAIHNIVLSCRTRLLHHPSGSGHSTQPNIKLSGLCQPSLIRRLLGSKYSPHSLVHYQVKNETVDKSKRVLHYALSKRRSQRG